MNSVLFSLESNDRNEHHKVNQFCLSLFKDKSFEDLNLWAPHQLEEVEDKQISHNLSNFFQMQFNSLEGRIPSLEYFIKKEVVQEQPPRITPAIRDYKKNICRNILRHAIKALSSAQSIHFLRGSLSVERATHFIHLYSSKLEFISGFRVLKDEIIAKQDDDALVREQKEIFRRYLEWFVRERASIYIIKGEASNLKEYLTYKNEVLLYYLQHPEEWYSNKPLWKSNGKAQRSRKIRKVAIKKEHVKQE